MPYAKPKKAKTPSQQFILCQTPLNKAHTHLWLSIYAGYIPEVISIDNLIENWYVLDNKSNKITWDWECGMYGKSG